MLALVSAGLLLTACSTKVALPPLPQVDASKFEPAVRQAIERAAQAAATTANAHAVQQFGMVLHAHDQFAAAAAAYRRALALDPANAETPYYLGLALIADGKYADALAPLRQALAAQSSVAARLKLADALLQAGDPAAAQQEYRALLTADPSFAPAHYGLARTLQGPEAIAAFNQALALFPRYGAAQFALAAAYRRAGNNAEGTQALLHYERDKLAAPPVEDPAMEKVYALNASSTGLLRQAQILEREGRLAEALALHQQVVQAAPQLDQAWVNLISLYARTQQPDQAEQAYRRAIALAPNRADAYYNFGVFCFTAGRWADAGRAFQHALELDPRHAEAALNLGAVVERGGDLTRAMALFQKAIALEPHHRLAHFHLGRIYASQRRFDQAIAEFDRTIEPLDAQSPTYLYALGATHARAGHQQQARQFLHRAKAEAIRFGQQSLVASIERDSGALSR